MGELQKGTSLDFMVRTADQTRQAEVQFTDQQTAAEVIQTAADHWALPTDTDYTLINVSTGQSIAPSARLADAVQPGQTLEIQPVLVAGT